MVLCCAFLAFSLPPYLTFDPGQSRLPPRLDLPLHYQLLVGHIVFGSVALVASCFQIWPWFRQRHRVAHRWIGRAYLFCGVFPAGLMTLWIAPFSSQGLVAQVANTSLGVLWLLTAVAGYRMARQRRFAEHREWMIRSFALTWSIVVNRVWLVLWIVILTPQVGTTFGGDDAAMTQAAAGVSTWLSWVVNLLVAEWWLQRTRRVPAAERRQPGSAELLTRV
jgi:hypothetical protein